MSSPTARGSREEERGRSIESAAQWGFHDKWALHHNECDRGRFYLEIGVHDGKNANNTFVLDKDYGWSGVCVDPFMHNMEGRTCRQFNIALGDSNSDNVEFLKLGAHSGLDHVSTSVDTNLHAAHLAEHGERVKVNMRTPRLLMQQAQVPAVIDYMSLDVEGAEMTILNSYPFEDHCIRAVSVETNNQKGVESDLNALLTSYGYTREGHSGVDEFYVKNCDAQ